MRMCKPLLPLLHWKFKDPSAPAWFQAHVRNRLQVYVPNDSIPWGAIAAIALPVPVLAFCAYCLPSTMGVVILLIALWGILVLNYAVQAYSEFRDLGQDMYAAAVEYTWSNLTGHERLMMRDITRHQTP